MKPEETEVLISYRLEQAQTALDDARYLLDGQRSPQGIINRSYYARNNESWQITPVSRKIARRRN